MMHVIAYLHLAGLMISREWDTDEFPAIGDMIDIGGEQFEVLSIERLDIDVIAVQVITSQPWRCDGWTHTELGDAMHASALDIVRALYV
jgi:hypothetical protein